MPNGAGFMDYEDVDPDYVAHQRRKQLFIKRLIQYKNAVTRNA